MPLSGSLASIRDFLSLLATEAGWRTALVVVLMIGVSLTEGASVVLLVPLLQVVGVDVQGGTVGRIAESASAMFRAAGIRPTLIGVLVVYIAVTAARAVLQRTQAVAAQRLQHDFVLQLRIRLYEAITRTQWLFFSRSRTSDFTHVLTAEVDRVGALTSYVLSLAVQSLVASVYLVLALQLSLRMTALAVLCGIALLIILRRGVGRSRTTGEQLTQGMSRLYAAATEHLGGMKTAKSYGAEGRNIGTFTRHSRDVAEAHLSAGCTYASSTMWFQVGSVVILGSVLFVAVDILQMPAAGILLLLFLFARLVPQFSGIQRTYQYLTNVLPSFLAVRSTLERCEAAVEMQAGRAGKVPFEKGVSLTGVTFGYRGEGSPVLRGLDLEVPANCTTAIIGRSGTGKSTIADLILGLLVPDSGKVLIDGKELTADRVRGWRDQIGYVAQDTVLFHDSIRANLLWATPDATEAEMWSALRFAAAEDFVRRMPQGLDTLIGDRGVQLSGGERQRLALARALLRKPALLILDEASSALDSENEQRIQRAIEGLHGRLTVLVITHRLASIRGADSIYVLDDGGVVESGSWSDLASRSEVFLGLCRAQEVEPGGPSRLHSGMELVG